MPEPLPPHWVRFYEATGTPPPESGLAPTPDYSAGLPDYSAGLPDPEPCSCEEALALRVRLARAEARARAWHRVARLKSRLLHERDAIGPASRGAA